MSSNKKLDLRDIRLSPFGWKNDLPDCPAKSLLPNTHPLHNARGVRREGHQAVAIPGCNGANDQMIVLGGFLGGRIGGLRRTDHFLKSCQRLAVSGQENPLWCESSIPDMNASRPFCGSVFVDGNRKLYAFGGDETTFEVLDFDDLLSGWKLHRMPSSSGNQVICKAVAIDSQFIYVLICRSQELSFCSFDTQTYTWNLNLEQPPCRRLSWGFNMTSICIPGDGTYVIILGEGYVNEDDINNRAPIC